MVNINEYLLKYYFILFDFLYSFLGHFLSCAFQQDLSLVTRLTKSLLFCDLMLSGFPNY